MMLMFSGYFVEVKLQFCALHSSFNSKRFLICELLALIVYCRHVASSSMIALQQYGALSPPGTPLHSPEKVAEIDDDLKAAYTTWTHRSPAQASRQIPLLQPLYSPSASSDRRQAEQRTDACVDSKELADTATLGSYDVQHTGHGGSPASCHRAIMHNEPIIRPTTQLSDWHVVNHSRAAAARRLGAMNAKHD
jgi:hypothetical protein